jgi:hypothetical protein
MLRALGAGFGAAGMASELCGATQTSPLAPKAPQFPARAKHVIFLFLNGGPSQVDTFDPKPLLSRHDGEPAPGSQTAILFKSPFSFKKYGQSGIEISELFPRLASQADDLCVIRSMFTEQPNHEPSLLTMNSGSQTPGRPSMGSWVTYGLGSENENLPGFVVMCPGLPVLGAQLWSSGFLPAVYQATSIGNGEKTLDKLIPYIRNPEWSNADQIESASTGTVTSRNSRPPFNPPKRPSACRLRRPRFSTSRRSPEKFAAATETPISGEVA